MTTKNPFEIRLDLLKMAKDMLQEQHDANIAFAKSAFDRADTFGSNLVKVWHDVVPKMYTPDDIIKQAKELQKFVDGK
jgi:hypothetical protein